jgi:hypothetical protein
LHQQLAFVSPLNLFLNRISYKSKKIKAFVVFTHRISKTLLAAAALLLFEQGGQNFGRFYLTFV